MIETIESYIIDEKLYVATSFICAYFNTDPRNIRNWKKNGLQSKKVQGIRQDLFIFDEVYEWNKKNINPTKSRSASKKVELSDVNTKNSDDIEEQINDIQGKIKQANELLQLKGTTHDDADRIKKILDGLIQAVKLGEQTKELIPKKDTEKVIIEFVVTLIAGYRRDIKILPKELEKRDRDEIRAILEKTYKSNIEKYKKMAKSEIVAEVKIYHVMEIVFQLIIDGVETDEILKRIESE